MQPTYYGQPPYPPPLPHRPIWKNLYVVGGLTSLLFLCLLFAGYTGALQRFVLFIEPSCTVGVTGAAATMTIIAWSANQDCDDILSGRAGWCADAASCVEFYLYTGTPSTPVICEVDRNGRHYIVRDEGYLDVVGKALCNQLLQPET